jgi:hypothetical protein
MRSDRFQSAVGSAAPELGRGPARDSSGAARPGNPAVRGWLRTAAMSRLVIGLTLIAGGFFWAIARGLDFYGLTLVHIGYDLDQPPLLLVFVGAWLLYRSRRR